MRSKTGKKVSHSILTSTLKNPFYAGIMRWNNQEKKGKHLPMITLKEHKRILQIMNSHNQHACRRRKYNFLLRGFVFCNICKQRYTAEKHIAKNKEYYHCASRKKHSNQGQNIEVKELEGQIEKKFKAIQFSPKFINLVIKKVKAIYTQKNKEVNKEKQALYNKKNAIENQRDVAEKKLFKGIISDEDFIRIRDKFKINIK